MTDRPEEGTVSDPMVEFLLDVMAEGWLPHPFLPHLCGECALCGATADRAVHDRTFAEERGLTWRQEANR